MLLDINSYFIHKVLEVSSRSPTKKMFNESKKIINESRPYILEKLRPDKQKKLITVNKLIKEEGFTRPKCRRLNVWPNPEYEGPFEISRAALTAKLPPRLHYLAQPKPEPVDPEAREPVPVRDESWYKRKVVLSARQLELAKPRQYPDDPEEKVVRTTRTMTKQMWLAYQKKLETFAAPKRTPPSPVSPVRRKKPLSALLPRLEQLAKPAYRPPNMNEKTDEEMRTIKKSALNYQASERILKLSVPKPLDGEALLDLNHEQEERRRLANAKRYVLSERMKKLAEPLIKKPGLSEDVKDNPYKVNPRALQYKATARIKRLARPRIRN